jgi:hypothetical protein
MQDVKLIVLLALIGISFIGCEREKIETDPAIENETDPAKIILGKWELTEIGNWPDMDPVSNPLEYIEYLPDSVLRVYEYKTKKWDYEKYWINDTLLYENIATIDTFQLIICYRYQFSDKNYKLRLDIEAFAIFKTAIYKRIN